jgi:plasmid stabilization system protein ParE
MKRSVEDRVETLPETISCNYERNPSGADRVVDRIYEAIESLDRSPIIIGRLGRVFGTRELVIPETKYIVTNRIVDEVIHILAILYGLNDGRGTSNLWVHKVS